MLDVADTCPNREELGKKGKFENSWSLLITERGLNQGENTYPPISGISQPEKEKERRLWPFKR